MGNIHKKSVHSAKNIERLYMKLILKTAILIFTIWMLNSCSKDIKINEPVVEVFSPQYKQAFLLPDTVYVSFRVEHDKPIEYIRVSIADKNMIPVSNQEFLYPESNNYKGDIYLPVGALPEDNNLPPYYLRITVSDFSQITHTNLELNLTNKEMKYKGCFLISRYGIDVLKINYFDDNYQLMLSTSTNGNYLGSDISANANMLYLITAIPDLARAFNCDSGDIIWSKEPQLPYPEFNSILVSNNIIYFSTEIGRIIGLTLNDGLQIFTTPVLSDSIPNNICTTAEYLVSDFSLRNSYSKVLVSFYKETGNKFQLFPTNYETVSMYGMKNENLVTVFCNKNSNGAIYQYDVDDNNIETQLGLTNIEIHHTCKIDDNNFLFSSDNKLFNFNIQDWAYMKITDTDNNIIDIKFDGLNNHLFVLTEYNVDVFTYPGLNKITSIESINSLAGVELKFGF